MEAPGFFPRREVGKDEVRIKRATGMLVLGVETATSVGSVAIVEESGLIAELTLKEKVSHSERLLPTIDLLLSKSKLSFSEIDALSVSRGPGSFTGLRIGISTIKGLAMAGNKPVVAIPSLDALAENYLGSDLLICPMIDARKDEVFTALYRRNHTRGLQKLTSDLAIAPPDFLPTIKGKVGFLGDGSQRYRALIEDLLGDRAVFAPPWLHFPRAAVIAYRGLEEIKSGNSADVDKLTPLYVRAPDAELDKGRQITL